MVIKAELVSGNTGVGERFACVDQSLVCNSLGGFLRRYGIEDEDLDRFVNAAVGGNSSMNRCTGSVTIDTENTGKVRFRLVNGWKSSEEIDPERLNEVACKGNGWLCANVFGVSPKEVVAELIAIDGQMVEGELGVNASVIHFYDDGGLVGAQVQMVSATVADLEEAMMIAESYEVPVDLLVGKMA